MGNSHSTPAITSRDLERWRLDGRPVLVDRHRRRQSPGGRYHDRRQLRIVRDGYGGGFERYHSSSQPRQWRRGGSGPSRDADADADASPPVPSASSAGRHADAFFVPRSHARASAVYQPDPIFGGTETVFHGCSRAFDLDRTPLFRRGPVIVEEVWSDSIPPPHRYHPSMPQPSFRGPCDTFRGPFPYPPHPYPPRPDHGGPYMSGGLGRGDWREGAQGGSERVPERGRIGFRPELLLEDGRES